MNNQAIDPKYAIQARGLNIYYGNFRAVEDVDLDIRPDAVRARCSEPSTA